MNKLRMQMPSNTKNYHELQWHSQNVQISMNSCESNQGSNSKVPMLYGALSYPSWDHTSICTCKGSFQSVHASIDAQKCPVLCLWEPRRQPLAAMSFRTVRLAKTDASMDWAMSCRGRLLSTNLASSPGLSDVPPCQLTANRVEQCRQASPPCIVEVCPVIELSAKNGQK